MFYASMFIPHISTFGFPHFDYHHVFDLCSIILLLPRIFKALCSSFIQIFVFSVPYFSQCSLQYFTLGDTFALF